MLAWAMFIRLPGFPSLSFLREPYRVKKMLAWDREGLRELSVRLPCSSYVAVSHINSSEFQESRVKP